MRKTGSLLCVIKEGSPAGSGSFHAIGLSAKDLLLLDQLRRANPKARCKVMVQSPRLRRLLRAVAYTVLKGNVPMSCSQFQKLSCSDIAERGGFLPALLNPLLGSVLGGLTGKLLT